MYIFLITLYLLVTVTLEDAANYVIPCGHSTIVTPTTPVPFLGSCPMTGYSYPYGECREWDVATMVVLDKNSSADELENIKQFIQNVTFPCTSSSTFQYFAPGMLDDIPSDQKCASHKIGSSQFSSFVSNLQISDTWIESASQNHPVTDMFRVLFSCQRGRVLSRGGVLYFFTNLKCKSSCLEMNRDMYDLVSQQEYLVNQLRTLGYLLKVIYLVDINSSPTSSTAGDTPILKCDIKTVLDYATKYEEVIISGGTVSCLDTYVKALMPCPENMRREMKRWRKGELLLIILVPIVCALFVSTLFLTIYIYRRKARGTLKEEFNLRQHKPFERLHAFHENLVGMLSERYSNLKIAAERQRLIDPSLLFIEATSLGSGAFATVSKGLLAIPEYKQSPTTSARIDVAVKQITKTTSDNNKLAMFKEMIIMKIIGHHPHCLVMLGSVSSLVEPAIILEYCMHTDLLSLLRKSASPLQSITDTMTSLLPLDLLSLAWQISVGMEHIHSLHILHRDLAARNVMVASGLIAKVGDFGLSIQESDENIKGIPEKLALKWSSPEAIEQGEFSKKSDVWSYGVVLFEIFSSGLTPFIAIQPEDVLAKLKEGLRLILPPDANAPTELSQLMADCFFELPQLRPPFPKITTRLSRLLRANDDDFGYIQVNRRSTLQSTVSNISLQ